MFNKIFNNIGLILLGLGLGLIMAQYLNLNPLLILTLIVISLIGGGFLIALGIKRPRSSEKLKV